MILIRRIWFRLAIFISTLGIANIIFHNFNIPIARSESIQALRGATLLFALCATISIALLTNYVRGLKRDYYEKVHSIRGKIEDFFDKHKDSEDEDIKLLINNMIFPFMNLSVGDWLAFNHVNEISENSVPCLESIHKKISWFLPRYFTRLEDEINELGILFIRRIAAELHIENTTGTFTLIASGIIAIGFIHFIPDSTAGNYIINNISLSLITYSVIELLLIWSFLRQELTEETPESD